VDYQQSVQYKSTTIKILWPVRTATSSKDSWIGAYSIGLTIPGKHGCPIKKKEEEEIGAEKFAPGWSREWKGINRKQITRWQHLSRLKVSVFFSLQKIFTCYETQQLILGTGTAIWWVTEPHCRSKQTDRWIRQGIFILLMTFFQPNSKRRKRF
jgi:hypothetical protein